MEGSQPHLTGKVFDTTAEGVTRSSMNFSKSLGVNGFFIRISKARAEMKCDSSILATSSSPLVAISSGRYSLGRRSLMTSRLVPLVRGVRLSMVSIEVFSAYSLPRLFGTM